uniref:Leucine-rich repeat-containing N-terminal plant-type domain-containing protein n=1 Tax=Tetradesmus obliquus TaxID=3088 RepID=A0A383W3G1_TETOB
MAMGNPSWMVLLMVTAAAAVQQAQAAAAAGGPAGDVQVLLALAKALDPTGKALPTWRADNTQDWCKQWLAGEGCSSQNGRLWKLDISQAGLKAAAPLQGTLPQQLPSLSKPLDLWKLQISGTGITGGRNGCCRWL